MKTTWATSNDFFGTPRPVIDNYHPDGYAIPIPIDLSASQVIINKLLDKRYILVDYSEVGAIPMLKPWQIRINSLMANIQDRLGPIGYDLSIKIDTLRKGIEENIVKTKEYECDFRKQYSTPYGIDEIGSEKIKQKQQERDNNITILVQNIENYVEKQPEFLKNSMATIMHDLEWLIPKSR